MVPYFMLLIIPLFCQLLFSKATTKDSKKDIKKEIALPLFLLIYSLLLIFRNKYLGRDLGTYESIFIEFGRASLKSITANISEILFKLYCRLFYNYISKNYQLFISFTAIWSVLPIVYVYCKDKSHGFLKATIFVNLPPFIMYFSGIRQGLAMSVGLMAYNALTKKKYVWFFVWSVIAIFTHHTGFMVLFMFPLYLFRIKKEDLIWLAPLCIVLLFFIDDVFNLLILFFSSFNEKYDTVAKSNGAFWCFILFVLFSIFVFAIQDDRKMVQEDYALRNMLVFSTIIQTFASVNMLAMRMSYYYILLIPICVGKSIKLCKSKYRQIAKIGEVTMCTFFSVYFFYVIISSYISGHSTLDTIPYVPFWMEI